MADGYDVPPTYEEATSTVSDNTAAGPPTYYQAWVDGSFDKYYSLKVGIDIVTKATEEDKKKNYEEALRLYDKSLEYFDYAMKNEAQCDLSKDAILKKLDIYKERAEKLRTFLADMGSRREEQSSLNIAIDIVTKAVEEDKNKNYEEALILYGNSMEYFESALKTEALSDKSRKAVLKKVVQYRERTEIIRKCLHDENIKYDHEDSDKDKMEEMHSSALDRDSSENVHQRSRQELRDLSAKTPRGVATYANLHTSGSKWKDVPGLLKARNCLNEAVVIPAKFPHLFKGKRKPWRGILLFGPCGTGKFYLATAVAAEARIPVLFKVPCQKLSSDGFLTDGYIEQLLSAARLAKPSILFLEHVEYLHGAHQERPGPDPVVTNFYKELWREDENKGVTVVASTDKPWLLDSTLIKYLEKRIYIPMPDTQRRSGLFQIHLRCLSNKTPPIIPNVLTGHDYRVLGEESEGCSALDIAHVIQDLIRKPERMQPIVARVTKDDSPPDIGTEEMYDYHFAPDSPATLGNDVTDSETDSNTDRTLPPITMAELLEAINEHKSPISPEDLIKFQVCRDRWGEDGQ